MRAGLGRGPWEPLLSEAHFTDVQTETWGSPGQTEARGLWESSMMLRVGSGVGEFQLWLSFSRARALTSLCWFPQNVHGDKNRTCFKLICGLAQSKHCNY